jgi:hypothetical protein
MPDQHVLDRIDRWLAAGLIDDTTADRLRSAEAAEGGPQASMSSMGGGVPAAIGSAFGPAPSIAEIFAYLGAGFLLVAWHVLVMSWQQASYDPYGTAPAPTDYARIGLEWAVPAVALAVVGWFLLRRDDRGRRAVGVAFAVATFHVFGGANQALQGADYLVAGVVATAAATIVALLFRMRHRALLTQLTMLVALAGLSTTAFSWLGPRLFNQDDYGQPYDQIPAQLVSLAWWLASALAFGLLARREVGLQQRSGSNPLEQAATGRRIGLTRFAAGLTAVVGTAVSLGVARGFAGDGIPTVIADAAVLALSAVLLLLAARTASVYLYPAALGIILALTSLNATYVAEQTGTGVALLIEGAILLAGGLFADRLRRQFSRGGTGGSSGTPVAALVPDGSPMGPSEEATITEITPA